jgi:hypothetical protein
MALGSAQTVRTLRLDVYPGFGRINLEVIENYRRSYPTFYFVSEGGKAVLTYRWHAYARHWIERESPHFVFYYNPYKDSISAGVAVPTDLAVMLLERHWATMATLMNVSSVGKIPVYLVNSKPEMMSLFGVSREEGFIEPQTGSIITFFPDGTFEGVTTRLLFQASGDSLGTLDDTGGRALCRLLVRGVSAYGDGNGGYVRGKSALFITRTLIAQGRYIALRDALTSPENPLVVAEAASFVRFLVEEYGAHRFRSMIRQVHSDAQFIPVVERVYALPWASLEREFRVWVVRQIEEVREPSELVQFRILTHLWDVQRVGAARVYVDTEMPFPSGSAIGRILSLHRTRLAPHPLTIPYIYLTGSSRKLGEFHVAGSTYISSHVLIAANIEALEQALRSRSERRPARQ